MKRWITLSLALDAAVLSQSFVISTNPTRFGTKCQTAGFWGPRRMASNEEPDLFDYFDPLLSPHAYPNGISPDKSSAKDSERNNDEQRYDPLRIPSAASRTPQPIASPMSDNENSDLFDYFDPLLSPHAYPNGISPNKKRTEQRIKQEESSNGTGSITGKPSAAAERLDVFDPRLSPHAYPDGAPSTILGDNDTLQEEGRRVGILLMDHGSKMQASNDRLHELASVYQTTVGSDFVVCAAHMEIASPSIPEGLQELLDQGVDEIICHPYFLSANGRHVSQDIPQILSEAIQSLQIEIPVVTTEPVGANTQVMIGAIQSIVQTAKSSQRTQSNYE